MNYQEQKKIINSINLEECTEDKHKKKWMIFSVVFHVVCFIFFLFPISVWSITCNKMKLSWVRLQLGLASCLDQCFHRLLQLPRFWVVS